MDARQTKIATGAVALAGAGVLASRKLGPKLHAHCQSACAGKCGHAREQEDQARRACSPQAVHDAA